MHILSINTFFPFPQHRGMDVVYGNLLRAQARAHEVTMLSLRRTGREDAFLGEAAEVAKEVRLAGPRRKSVPERLRQAVLYEALAALHGRPKCTFYDTPAELRAAVRDLTRERRFDVIELHHSPCAGLVGEAVGGRRLLYMYDVHYRSKARLAETQRGLARMRSRIEAARFRRFEQAIVKRFDGVLFGQEADRAEMAPHVRAGGFTALMPNIIDTEVFAPDPAVARQDAVVFVGAMTHGANLDAVLHFQGALWDAVRARVPGIELWLVGAAPPPEIGALDGQRGIRVFADVPDVKPFVHGARVYIAPLRIGSGVKVKIMEALALGKAIVASPVAVEGMGLSDGREVCVREIGPGFADAVAALIADAGAREGLEQRARTAAIELFGVAHGNAELDAIYARLGEQAG